MTFEKLYKWWRHWPRKVLSHWNANKFINNNGNGGVYSSSTLQLKYFPNLAIQIHLRKSLWYPDGTQELQKDMKSVINEQ